MFQASKISNHHQQEFHCHWQMDATVQLAIAPHTTSYNPFDLSSKVANEATRNLNLSEPIWILSKCESICEALSGQRLWCHWHLAAACLLSWQRTAARALNSGSRRLLQGVPEKSWFLNFPADISGAGNLGHSGPLWATWATLGHFGPLWATWATLGHFGPFGPLWATLGHLGHFGPFGPLWAIWATLGHLGHWDLMKAWLIFCLVTHFE